MTNDLKGHDIVPWSLVLLLSPWYRSMPLGGRRPGERVTIRQMARRCSGTYDWLKGLKALLTHLKIRNR